MRDPILDNQTLAEHPFNFDPLNKKAAFDKHEDGSSYVHYVDIRPGVEILDFGVARFNFYAPEAKSITLVGWGGSLDTSYELKPDTDGYFSYTATDIRPGFHYCHFIVDGVETTNPEMPFGYGSFRVCNFFEMPDHDSDFFLIQDVPHGDIRMDFYKSSLTGRWRSCYVYTPPGYDADIDRRYPVLYIQHGGGENEVGWLWQGKINFIADNLLAAGKMEPMIIVMNNGYMFKEDGTSHEAIGSIDEVIAVDCVPYIDSKYRTVADRRSRAVAGLSMGAMQANVTIMKNLDLFANAGMFSGGFSYKSESYDCTELFEDIDKYNETFGLLFASAGDDEPMCAPIRKKIEGLNEKGIPTVFYSCPGFHEWDVWRYAAREFMMRLFK